MSVDEKYFRFISISPIDLKKIFGGRVA